MIPRLHLVTDDRVLEASGFPERARQVAEVGGDRIALHLRGPGLTGRRLWEVGREVAAPLGGTGVRLLVNDRVDLALALEAHGAHLGSRSLPPAAARRVLGPEALLGRSVHGASEVEELAREPDGLGPLDYLLVGTIWATPSHPERPGAGPERIREIRRVAPGLPVLGIGGVTPERVGALLAARAHGAAVLRAVWEAPDPAGAVAAFLAALEAESGRGPGSELRGD